MRYDAPKIFVWDKNGKKVNIGDVIEWTSDSYVNGYNTTRKVRGIVYGIVQTAQNWNKVNSPVITKLKVRSKQKYYNNGNYYPERPVLITLRNMGNISKVDSEW